MFYRKFANLVAPPTDVTTKRLVRFKACLSSNSRRKLRPNRSIIGDAILPQNAMKLTETCDSEFGGLLWCHLPPQKNCNMGSQLQFLTRTTAQSILEKFTTLGAHKLVRSEPFLDYLYEVWHFCCQRYIAICGRNLYKCTSTFSTLNHRSGILLKSFCYLYEVVRKFFVANFCTFRNFRPQFRGNFGANWRCKWELSSRSERAIPSEKRWKQNENPPKTGDPTLVQSMCPSNNSAPADRSVTNKQKTSWAESRFIPAPAHGAAQLQPIYALHLRCPARLASSSCGRHEYSRCTRRTMTYRRQTLDSIIA